MTEQCSLLKNLQLFFMYALQEEPFEVQIETFAMPSVGLYGPFGYIFTSSTGPYSFTGSC